MIIMSKNDEFAKRLQSARLMKSWSQQDLSRNSGVDQAQISRYESGASLPRPRMASKLAEALNVSALWLMGSTAIPDPTPEDRFGIHVEVSRELINQLQQEADELGISVGEAALARIQRAEPPSSKPERLYVLLDSSGHPISWAEIHEHIKAICNAGRLNIVDMETHVITPDMESSSRRAEEAAKLAAEYRKLGKSAKMDASE